ncbi:MAG: hypothetical protein ACLSBB_14585 [Ruthenibacterium lactatiformans]
MSAVKAQTWAQETGRSILCLGPHRSRAVVILYPLIFVLVASISDPMEIFQGNV